jgi:hypothetical protein
MAIKGQEQRSSSSRELNYCSLKPNSIVTLLIVMLFWRCGANLRGPVQPVLLISRKGRLRQLVCNHNKRLALFQVDGFVEISIRGQEEEVRRRMGLMLKDKSILVLRVGPKDRAPNLAAVDGSGRKSVELGITFARAGLQKCAHVCGDTRLHYRSPCNRVPMAYNSLVEIPGRSRRWFRLSG